MAENDSLSNIPLISRVRRNHALEHATMNVLSERHKALRLVGRSSFGGFYIYGAVSAEDVIAAAQEGLQRLKAGRREMAVHPTCGTNLAVAGILAGMGAFLALGGLSRNRPRNLFQSLIRLPMACTAAMVGIFLAQPLGPFLQARVTTEADVGDMHIIDVAQERRAGILVHHVRTSG
ncbi:MAG: hypothetical protein JXA14_12685 [Anaerolineae bacterium]|jgi:hypothetical protein|nr:hypothetical protein [Anaerolineae bacterium]